jgi:hypothetical protein
MNASSPFAGLAHRGWPSEAWTRRSGITVIANRPVEAKANLMLRESGLARRTQ